ncbi:hypothetical protein [Dyella sp. 2HG41-7]|uniref:RHS repeat domain-containing protein n=1 Tax=Dyella sp. 2HG41-7 TaxID=2883239 RepID=UPI001F2E606D|nr:hypothetical protein [Dyella sp. 2HG41-7]
MAALFALAGWCHAQSVTPEDDYKQLIQVDQNIHPLGEHPFGENISLYDGTVSFEETDVVLKGNGPTIQLGRVLAPGADVPTVSLAFADWDLDIPRIETISANQANVTGWDVPGNSPLQRCTYFGVPPEVGPAQPGGDPWSADQWWYGYHLMMPGQGSQTLLQRATGSTPAPTGGFNATIGTTQNWMLGCGVTASDGGEGFQMLAPDGTLYTFAHLAYHPIIDISKPAGTAPDAATVGAQSLAATTDLLYRRDALMYVTQIKDRFGNTLTYNYDSSTGYLTSITASDGREVDISYQSGSPLISSITATATNVSPRKWYYSYNTPANTPLPTLTGVQLPDGSTWSYQLSNFRSAQLATAGGDCEQNTLPVLYSSPATGSITHPSGLTATFTLAPVLHGRSYVPKECMAVSDTTTQETYAVIPNYYYQYSVTSEVVSGAGVPTETWNYSYSAINRSWTSDSCASNSSCPSSVYVDVTDPGGNDTRYTFSNRFNATEGQLLRTDRYSGSSSGTLIRSEVNTYANPTGGPWPSNYGNDLQDRDNNARTTEISPLSQRTITQDSQNYTWQATAFNAYAQPTDVKRYNDVPGQSSIEETTTYLNDTNTWVLGLPQTVTNVGTGEVEISNAYNTLDELTARARFGQTLMNYGWNSAGQLANFKDGNNNTTLLGNYYRGIPQQINYPDGGVESLTVDDLGDITSTTDQNNYTTQYSYDAIGRIHQIIYPYNSNTDSAQWFNKTFTYTLTSASERGISGPHWDRTATVGNAITTTYFDADLRPILTDTSNGSQDITTVTNYDWTGATTLASYPVYGTPDFTAVTTGTHHQYDALEREDLTTEDSELGALNTITNYVSGAGIQVTDPKGNVTTTYYQVFDTPSYNAPIQVNAPLSVVQSIARDIYGNPTSITQSGPYGGVQSSLTRTLMYDGFHRLCRTTEPESGSTVMFYDGANNLKWNASGQVITDGTCGTSDVPAAVQTVRTYDPMNRVLTVTPPTGTQSTSYTYDYVGNLKTSASGITSQAFYYNTRNLLTSETLSVPGYSWGMAYVYDGYPHVSAIGYPSFNGTNEGVSYNPDALGRVTQVGSYVSGITYFPDSQVSGFNYGSGASYVAGQNTRQLLSNFSYGVGSASAVSEGLAYDSNGNITNISDQVNGVRTKSFQYDALNRLTNAAAPNLYGTEVYQYDALNNLRTRLTGGNTLTFTLEPTNQVASVSMGSNIITTYGYDNQGNRNSVSSGGTNTNYNFDAENQLLQVSGVEGYDYDAAGRRVAKTALNGAVSDYYFYDQAGQLMYDYNPTTAIGTNYFYVGTKLVAKHATVQLTAPTNLTANPNPNTGNFTVSWGASNTATIYTLQESINGGAWNTIYSGSGTSAALTGRAGGSYAYRVQASNSSAHSTWASLSSVGVWPAIPTVTVPSGSVNSSYTVSWTASPGATGYNVQMSAGGGWITIASNTAATSISQPGNAYGTYTYQVEAINQYGSAGWSAPASVVVNNAGVMPSPAPTLTVSSPLGGKQTITWTIASPVTGYTLQQSFNKGAWTTVYSGTNTQVTLTGLSSFGSYTYQLQACNNSGGQSACTGWVSPSGSGGVGP